LFKATFFTLFLIALRSRCGHYIFALFLLSFFFSSSNLSGRRLDVYHTSTYGVACPECEFRMQVWNAQHAARLKYRTQKSPNTRHLGTIAQLCQAVSSQVRHTSIIRKKTC